MAQYQTIPVELNGVPFDTDGGIVVGGYVTYLKYSALYYVHTEYTQNGNTVTVNGKAVPTVVPDGSTDPYVPWYTISEHVKAVHVGKGWNFITDLFTPPNHPVLAVWDIDVWNNAFFLDVPIKTDDPTVKSVGKMQFDTGAFSICLDSGIADTLKLPHGNPMQIQGIGGLTDAYTSTMTVVIGDREIAMPIVCTKWTDQNTVGLFGMKGFIDNGIGMLIDPVARTITLLDTTKTV